MKCTNCNKNEATVHSVKIINGVRTEEHLCPECAAKRRDLFTSFRLNERFMSPAFRIAQTCSRCGTSFGDFLNTGLFGCDDCYDVFSEMLDPVLTYVFSDGQESSRSIGPSPEDLEKPANNDENNKKSVKTEEETLRSDLEKAIKEERFEDAAVIRDRIKALGKEE